MYDRLFQLENCYDICIKPMHDLQYIKISMLYSLISEITFNCNINEMLLYCSLNIVYNKQSYTSTPLFVFMA
jgi:hypothetical protein